MKVSARNLFEGTISALIHDSINTEVELTLRGGDKLTAIVTESSVHALNLSVGKTATALVKAPWVILLTGGSQSKFSARNQLSGKVQSLTKGAVNTEVAIELPSGNLVHAVITNDAVKVLQLSVGVPASALIKASNVILAIPA
ncbi:MAG: TOBE domain-containing protein [Aeromonadaceae bacterium]